MEDQGEGIPEDERKLVFEPFYRSRTARQSGVDGHGLGLALVARIAEVLGGRVEYAATSPPGSRFSFYLPLVRESLADEPIPFSLVHSGRAGGRAE